MHRTTPKATPEWGGVLYDSAGQTCFFFSEELSCDFLFSVKKAEQKNMIQELDVSLAHCGRALASSSRRKTCCYLFGQRICPWELLEVMVAERCKQPATQENLFSRRKVLLPNLVREGSKSI